MSIDEIYKELDLFLIYQKHIIDIKANDIKRWVTTSSKYQLPTFEYFKQNCINDKGGNYDFTVRRYGNSRDVKELSIKDSIINRTKKVSMKTTFSIWMGTPFNFKDEILCH